MEIAPTRWSGADVDVSDGSTRKDDSEISPRDDVDSERWDGTRDGRSSPLRCAPSVRHPSIHHARASRLDHLTATSKKNIPLSENDRSSRLGDERDDDERTGEFGIDE